MQWLIKWGVKKWLVGVVNTALVTYADKVEAARVFLHAVIAKVEAVTLFLHSLDAKLTDNEISDEEADAAIEEAKTLAEKLIAK